MTLPGMVSMRLDPLGRLLRLIVVPPREDPGQPTDPGSEWWRPLFEAAGLNLPQYKDVPCRWTPPHAFDAQKAWAGKLPGHGDIDIHIEAAAYRGKPVYFEIHFPWPKAVDHRPPPPIAGYVFAAAIFGAVLFLAVRNLRLGRADTGRGLRFVLLVAGVWMLVGLLGSRHNLSLAELLGQVRLFLGPAILQAVLLGLLYFAVEPATRRRWPWRITAWNRLLAGRWRDPMVGRDLLLGLSVGILATLSRRLSILTAMALELSTEPPVPLKDPPWLDFPCPPSTLHSALLPLIVCIIGSLVALTVVYLFTLVLRLPWLAWLAYGLYLGFGFISSLFGPSTGANAVMIGWTVVFVVINVIFLARVGLLAWVGLVFSNYMLSLVPLTTDFSRWYAYQGLLGASVVIGLGTYCFVIATGGQRLFARGFFGDE